MTDKKILEAAARAAGKHIVGVDAGGAWIGSEGGKGGLRWSPLTDDGDALRLAMHLGMRVSLREAHADGGAIREIGDDEDEMAATRRAIVRAAAAMAVDA